MKHRKAITALLALSLLLTEAAIASGEPSGGGSGEPSGDVERAYIAVVDGAVKLSKKAIGSVTYTKVAKGSAKCLSVNKKTGKVTVAKGTTAGTYKLKMKVAASGNANYKAKAQTVTVKVIVK